MPPVLGTLHTYHTTRSLLLFEHANTSSGPPPQNTLLFVGGMFDNFLTPPYTLSLASLLAHSRHWRFAHVQLSSAMRGFGVSSLHKDVQELEVALRFVREVLHGEARLGSTDSTMVAGSGGGGGAGDGRGKVVLMGHSTGCQDALSYLFLPSSSSSNSSSEDKYSLANRPKVDGVILQAPVSDREGADPTLGPSPPPPPPSSSSSSPQSASDPQTITAWRHLLSLAHRTPEKERRTTVLPMHLTTRFFGPVPLSVERCLSLASPESPGRPGVDDLFSSDVPEEGLRGTFGRGVRGEVLRALPLKGGKEILVLPSKNDEHVPGWVDKEALLKRWRAAAEEGGGGEGLFEESALVEGGLHDLSGEEWGQRWGREVVMREKVVRYLDAVRGCGEGEGESEVWEVLRREREVLEKEKEVEGQWEGDVQVRGRTGSGSKI